jgi:hypothetical protein
MKRLEFYGSFGAFFIEIFQLDPGETLYALENEPWFMATAI